MADLQHRDLPEAQLHEPKGVSAASAGQVYVANGLGGGTWQQVPITFTNVVEVTSLSDFPAPVGNVIEPEANTGYYISGTVDLGNNVISIVNPGVAFLGLNRATDTLVTDSPNPLFTSTDQSIVFQGFSVANNNVSGNIFALSNSGTSVVLIDKIFFGNCNAIGSIGGFANIIIDNCGLAASGVGGCTFSGANTELIIRDSNFQGYVGNMFDLGSATFTFINVNGCRFFGTPTDQAFSGLPNAGNVMGLGTITYNVFSGMDNPTGNNLDHADSGWFFQSNVGLQDSGFVGYVSMVNNPTLTSNPGINQWAKIAGTTVASPENERFNMTADNELTSEVLLPRPVEIILNISGVKGGGTDKIEITVFKDSGSGFQIVNANAISRTDFSTTARAVSVVLLDTAQPGDIYSAYIRNIEDTSDMEVENMQLLIKG